MLLVVVWVLYKEYYVILFYLVTRAARIIDIGRV
jgi:hypothetical protein